MDTLLRRCVLLLTIFPGSCSVSILQVKHCFYPEPTDFLLSAWLSTLGLREGGHS